MTRKPGFQLRSVAFGAAVIVALVESATGASRAAGELRAQLETPPVASSGDAADDAAIWVDARRPERSVIIATDKRQGLYVYDLEGKPLQALADGRMNNVDVRDGFLLDGESVTVVAATNRTNGSIALYKLDTASRQLSSIADGVLESGLSDLYGLCMYRSRSGAVYVIASNEDDGKVRQWRLVERSRRVGLELVRELTVGSQAEGCVADDESGGLYVAEEDVGLWRYSAEPDGGSARTSIDRVAGGNLAADVEGVAIYYAADGKGFLIASSQGENKYAVYRREGANEYVGKFAIVANERGVDGVSDTDGLDVTSAALGPRFPAGLLVVQDGENGSPSANQNFKYLSWRDVESVLQLR